MIDLKKGLLVGLAALVLAGCGAPEPQSEVVADNERAVSRATYEGDWAFTADSGTLGCIDKATYFDAGDETYALSGFSRAYSDNKGLDWLPVDPNQPFWLDHPELDGVKVSVGNMISDALELCE